MEAMAPCRAPFATFDMSVGSRGAGGVGDLHAEEPGPRELAPFARGLPRRPAPFGPIPSDSSFGSLGLVIVLCFSVGFGFLCVGVRLVEGNKKAPM